MTKEHDELVNALLAIGETLGAVADALERHTVIEDQKLGELKDISYKVGRLASKER